MQYINYRSRIFDHPTDIMVVASTANDVELSR